MRRLEPARSAAAVRLGRLLRRGVAGAATPPLSAAQQAAFTDALTGAGARASGVGRGWWWGAAAVTAAVVALVVPFARGPRALTYERDGAGPAESIRFSDGSTLVVERGAQAQVLGVDARGARLAVERGEVAFQIRHRDDTRWSVAVGPFEIMVTGTAFDVRWTEQRELRVRLREGAVVVRGSLAGAGLEVKAGQTFVARLSDGEVQLGATTAEPKDREIGMGADRALRTEMTRTETEPAATTTTTAAKPAISDGEECVRSCDPERLDALAREARRRGDGELARRALLALRRKGKGSELGHEAAFVLGRLAEDRGRLREALALYGAYLAETEGGHYRPYALGRKMALLEQLDGPEAARPVAERYLQLHPDGPHATHARQLLAGP